MWQTSGLSSAQDLEDVRRMIAVLGNRSGMVDFEENIQLPEVRSSLRLWRKAGELRAIALVDAWSNLWFDCISDAVMDELGGELAAWGSACLRRRNAKSSSQDTLDFSCSAGDSARMRFASQNGFQLLEVRSLQYARSTAIPLETRPFPPGYSWRAVYGEEEAPALADLHRAAFGTEAMTVEERLAIMRAPQYQPDMDLVAEAPDGSLAAFCICGLASAEERVGTTDPIGVHPAHRGLGLAAALVTAGMEALIRAGVERIELGTSSDNPAMQRLARRLGFELIAEKVWFCKEVGG